jgi:alkyl hydroperoxide reductase subunit F
MYELVIVGGGPAGTSAGVYAARKKIKTLLITESFGGQSIVSDNIENWIGTKSISGLELAKSFEEHVKAQSGIEIIDGDLVETIEKAESGFKLKTRRGKEIETKTVLVASGSRRRKLDVPGGSEFEGKGVVYCSTCDAPLFQDKTVAVIGGGNAGLEAVIDLFPYAKKIYLLERNEMLRGDPETEEKLRIDPRVEIIFRVNMKEVFGVEFVNGLKYEDAESGEERELAVDGVFVEIGIVPNTDLVGDLVEKNKAGEIVVDHKTQRTSSEGIWAAGDVSDVLYKQNNISAGDGIKAVLNVYSYLEENSGS